MKIHELINQLKSHLPDTEVKIFGYGNVTEIRLETEHEKNIIKLIAQSKALDAMDAIQQLKSEICQCGNEKEPGKSFCLQCYRSLPPAIQKALYNRVGKGYEESYKFACKTLQEEK